MSIDSRIKNKNIAEKGYIYLIKNIDSGKGYVGLTRRSLKERFQGHIDVAKKRIRPEGTITHDISKYGRESFSIELLEEVASLELLSQREIFFIKELNTLSPHGYNQNRGGSVSLTPVTHYVEGVGYRGVGQLADAYDLLEETVRARLNTGWNVEQAVGLDSPPKFSRKGTQFQIGGKSYESEAALTKEFNIPIERFRARVHQMNWTIDQALELIERPLNQVTVDGKSYENLKLACDAFGHHKEKIRSRLNNGWTVDEAFEIVEREGKSVKPKAKPVKHFPLEVNGFIYNDAQQLADFVGVSVGTIKYRLTNKWSLDGLMKGSNQKALGKHLSVNGIYFPSLSEACRHFSIERTVAQSRLNMGWSIEEALGIKDRTQSEPAQIYVVRHPDGSISEVTNLSAFCRENDLKSSGNLSETLKSHKHHSYHGFSLIEIKRIK
jgi:GIY-YIG catalytic domain